MNKKTIISRTAIIVMLGFCAILLNLNACKKDKHPFSEPDLVQDQGVATVVTLMDSEVKMSIYPISNNNAAVEYSRAILSDNIHRGLLGNLMLNPSSSSNSIATVVYFNKRLSIKSNFVLTDIIGVSLYTAKEGKLYHALYGQQNGQFRYLADYSYEVNSVSHNQIQYNLLEVLDVHTSDELSYSVLRLENKSATLYRNGRSKFLLQACRQRNSQRDFVHQNYGTCPSPCDAQDGTNCDEYASPTGNPMCDPGECPRNEFYGALLLADTIDSITLKDAYDVPMHYDFRDDFLKNYPTGEKYIDYYYSFGAFLKGQVPVWLMAKTTYVLLNFNIRIDKLMNHSSNPNYVVINNQMKNSILDLIDDYRQLSLDVDYQDALDDIEADVNIYYGMTIQNMLLQL